MVEAGTVHLPESADLAGVQGTGVKIQELASKFPNAEKDDIDALTQFLNWRRKHGGTMEWFKAQAKKLQEQSSPEKAEGERIEHPSIKDVHRLAMEQAGMKVMKPDMSKQVKVGDLKKDAPKVCSECGSDALFQSAKGAKCLRCNHIMPSASKEVNIG